MFRPLTTELHKIARHWSARPFQAASLSVLLTLLIISGPLACVAHCVVVSGSHTAHHHAHRHVHQHDGSIAQESLTHHGVLSINDQGDHALCEYVIGQSSESVPSALTVGVVLAISFLPLMATVVFQRLDRKPQLRLLALPPPLDPPRYAPALA